MLKRMFATTSSEKEGNRLIVVVSGLPRSGTSMMMKMLADGGVPIVADSVRHADEDNPNGYYEFEPVKQLKDGNNKWLPEANKKAVKVVSALLEHLPKNYHYKIIFMEREIKEILASQRKMLLHKNEGMEIGDSEMEERFQKHLTATKYWLARQPNMDVLYVDYNRLISNPDDYCKAVADFIGLPVDISKMRSVPNERLYRNRGGHF